MTKQEIKELSLCEKEPRVGEYFGAVTQVKFLTPYYSTSTSYIYRANRTNEFLLLFKRISYEIVIEVSTGITFLLNPCYYRSDFDNESEKMEFFKSKFKKYREIGLFIDSEDYLKVNDDFKLLYSKEMNQDSKDKLKVYAESAHNQFDYDLSEIINKIHSIALVDNAMYDMEKKYKVKALTKPNDDQK